MAGSSVMWLAFTSFLTWRWLSSKGTTKLLLRELWGWGEGSLLGSLPLCLGSVWVAHPSFGMDLPLQLPGIMSHIPAATSAPSTPALAWLLQT